MRVVVDDETWQYKTSCEYSKYDGLQLAIHFNETNKINVFNAQYTPLLITKTNM
jgi:hypothetical protein